MHTYFVCVSLLGPSPYCRRRASKKEDGLFSNGDNRVCPQAAGEVAHLLAKTYAEASAKAQERFQEKYPVDKFYHEHVDTEAYNPTRRKRRLLTARENEVAKEKEMLKAAEKL